MALADIARDLLERERGKGDEMTDDDFAQPMGGAAAAACIQKDDRELTQQYMYRIFWFKIWGWGI